MVVIGLELPFLFSKSVLANNRSFVSLLSSENGKPALDLAQHYLLTRRYQDVRSLGLCAPELAAAALWEKHGRRVYLFNEGLAGALAEQADSDKDFPPVELPVPAFYVLCPGAICGGFDGFFAWAEDSILHFLFLTHSGTELTHSQLLTGDLDADESRLQDVSDWIQPHLEAAARSSDGILPLFYSCFGKRSPIHTWVLRAYEMVLYLCCDNAEIDPPDLKDLAPNTPVVVGRKIGAALASGNTGPRKAHIRKGHWHTFWTGPRSGPRKKVIKWVAPVYVGERTPDIDLVPVKD